MGYRLAGVIILLLAVYLIGNRAVSLWDRDEPRYAQASRQMLESGDWTTPMLLDELRLKKPPLIYWCQATAMRLLGINAGAARLPSVIATTLALALIGVALSRDGDWRTALWTVFIYGTAGLTIAAAKMSITDAMLTLFILTSQLCLYRLWRGSRCWWTVIGLGIAIGLAGLTKGPVVLGALAMTLVALWLFRLTIGPGTSGPDATSNLTRGAESLRPLQLLSRSVAILAIVTAVVAPWILALEAKHPGAITSMVRNEVLDRIAKPQEGHNGPPGYYLLAVWGTFFPWSLLLPAAMVEAWKQRNEPSIRFALAAVIGPWVMFEAVATKLPHYVLPTYAPLAYLVARVLLRSAGGLTPELRQPHWPKIAAAWAVLVAILGLFPWMGVWAYGPLPTVAVVGSIAVSLWGILFSWQTATQFARGRQLAAAGWMGAGCLGVFALTYAVVFPNSPYLRLSERVADALPPRLAVGDVIMIDYKESSLAFYQGGTIRPEPRNDFLATVSPEAWPDWVITTAEVWQKTPESAKAMLDRTGSAIGWGYADGNRRLELLILKRKPVPIQGN